MLVPTTSRHITARTVPKQDRPRANCAGLGWALVAAWALLLVVSSPSAAAKRTADPLAQVNARWSGARCTIRFELPIKKGKDKEGWSKSIWIVPGTDLRAGDKAARLLVSNRDVLPDGRIYPGRAFIADGWVFTQPDQQDGR